MRSDLEAPQALGKIRAPVQAAAAAFEQQVGLGWLQVRLMPGLPDHSSHGLTLTGSGQTTVTDAAAAASRVEAVRAATSHLCVEVQRRRLRSPAHDAAQRMKTLGQVGDGAVSYPNPL